MIATDVKTGTEVISLDGELLGTVVEIWADTPSHGSLPLSRYLLQNYGPISGNSALFAARDGYLQVRKGDVLGYNGRELLVPFSAVLTLESERRIMLRSTAAACEANLNEVPENLARAS